MNIKCLVATHKKYQMPEDKMYLPIHVGREGKEDIGYLGDNTGDNISQKNSCFCELTGLYWAWKNLDADYKGLAHYRRHFKGRTRGNTPLDKVLTKKEAERLFKETDIILPKKRNYWIETVYSHYVHTHFKQDLDITEAVLKDMYPEYVDAYRTVMNRKKVHMFNMIIAKQEIFDSYCEWLFSILFEIEKKMDVSNYTAFQARVYGRISEMLLDVWLLQNGYSYKEVPFIYMEPISWFKKGKAFLSAKFFHKKYTGSF